MSIGIILGIVIVLLFAGAIVFSAFSHRRRRKSGTIIGAALAALLAVLFIVLPFSCKTVDTGEVAVVKCLGEAKKTRNAGTYFDFWMTNTYTRYDTKVQNVDIATAAYSSDAQTMDITMTLQYQMMSDKAIEVAKEYGSLEVLQNRIESIAIEKTKSVLSSYKAMDIISDRASMSPRVEESIKAAIADEYHVTITTIVLTNIDFSDAFEKAVEDKMIAEQKQLQAEYENRTKVAAAEAEAQAAVQRAEGEAQAKLKEAQAQIEIAKAQAEAKLIAAEGDREAQLEIARAEAEAIRLQSVEVARSLGFKIVEEPVTDEEGVETVVCTIDFEGKTADEIAVLSEYLKYMEYLEKWNGELPDVVTDGSTVMIPQP